jgi:D-alanine transaminase
MPLADVCVPALDRAFLFGDAAYEVVRLYGGRPWRLAAHLDRFERSLGELRIGVDRRTLEERLAALLRHAQPGDASLYVQRTRGAGPRTHVPAPDLVPNELLWVQPLAPDHGDAKRRSGLAVTLCEDLRWARCDVKSVNLLGNCLAAMAARERGADEAVLVDASGALSEGTHATVLLVLDGTLVTPPLTSNILPSVTRAVVLDLARAAGLAVAERRVERAAVERCEEMLLCGTLTEVTAVVRVDGRAVGDGRPGPVAARLQALLRAAVAAEAREITGLGV